MKKNKLLFIFTTLNALISTCLIGAQEQETPKSEDTNSNQISRVTTKKSSKQRIRKKLLDKKNKELEELYKQADYIVKPEYLEWEVSFSAFYEEHGKGKDNTSENAEYYSKVEGYYDTEGNFIVTNKSLNGIVGKPYKGPQEPREINLGVSIPLKGMTREPLDLELSPIEQISINPTPPTIEVTTPSMSGNIGLLTFEPISEVLPPYLGKLSVNWPRTNTTGEIATLDTGSEFYENPLGTTITVDGSTGSKSIFYIGYAGKVVNNGTIQMDYNNTDGTNFHGIYSIRTSTPNGYRDFVNNGTFNMDINNTQDIGSVMGVHYYTHAVNSDELSASIFTADPQKIILSDGTTRGNYGQNYGMVNVKGAVWFQFEDTDGDYISHLPGKQVGSVIVDASDVYEDKAGEGFQIWRCCHVTSDGDGLARIDPGIVIVRRGSTGAHLYENANGLRTELLNLNNNSYVNTALKQDYGSFAIDPLNRSLDSQFIVEGGYKADGTPLGGNAVVFGTRDNIKDDLAEKIETPIYLTDQSTNAIVLIDGAGPAGGWSGWGGDGKGRGQVSIKGDINILVPIGSANGRNIENPKYGTTSTTYTVGGITSSNSRIVGIYTDVPQPTTNYANITNMFSGGHSVTLADSAVLSYTGNEKGVDRTVGIYVSANSIGLNPNGIVPHPGFQFAQDGGIIKIGGEESVAVYNNSSTVLLVGTTVEVHNGAVGMYTKGNGTVGSAITTIDNTNLIAGNGALLFYNEGAGQIDFQPGITATVKTGGTGFYSKGTTSLTDYLNINNLTVTMEENSTLLMLEEPLTPVYLTALPGVTGVNIDPASSTNYKKVTQYRGEFHIDKNVMMDNLVDDYVQTALISTKIYLDTGYKIIGTNDEQVGMKTGANSSITLNTDVSAINNSEINLAGNNTVGQYTNFGTNTNAVAGIINVSGINGAAIFAENGSKATNAGSIIIGEKGLGIYATSYQNASAPSVFGDGKIDVTNTGIITSNGGRGAVGIYADNNKVGSLVGNSIVNLSNGIIDLSTSENGLGVFVQKGIVTDTGSTITVGKDSLAFYAKDSDVTLNGTTINLNGDKALGVFLTGNSSLNIPSTTPMTINIDGRDTTLFYINSTNTSIVTNFNIGTVTPGSSYIIGNLNNGTIEFTGDSLLQSNGILVVGRTSEVVIDSAATITAAPGATNVAAVMVSGNYTAGSWIARPGMDGENQGTITLGNESVAIYGDTGANVLNTSTGVITVGDNSVALHSEGTGAGQVLNEGTITIGANSQGMALIEGSGILPTFENSGTITSTGAGSVAMYAENVFDAVNHGTISMLHDKSVGIYLTGTVPYTAENYGLIEVGNSTNIMNPSIGIYSNTPGDILKNHNTIISGAQSIGIYGQNVTIDQNGIMNVGDSGIAIYAVNSVVNLTSASTFNLGTNKTVGVYGINTVVTNDANDNIGNSNYGFILTNGSFVNNAVNPIVGTDSVFMYSSGATTVTNNGELLMTESDNVGFYTVNGSTVTNSGNITGTSGTSNVGIYNSGGTVNSTGVISLGNSELVFITDAQGNQVLDVQNSKYTVGIYGENSTIVNDSLASVSVGIGGIGIVAKGGIGTNHGTVTATGDHSMGMYTEKGTVINEVGATITVSGTDSIGMAGNGANSTIINRGTINVTGTNAIGMFGNLGTKITNEGTIIANGTDAQGIVISQGSELINTSTGTMIINSISSPNYATQGATTYPTPTIVNSGVIKVSEKFELDGMNVIIKVDPSTVRTPTAAEIAASGYDALDINADYLISNAVGFHAPAFSITDPLEITGNFAEGTNVGKYKLEDIIIPDSGQGISAGLIPVKSKSLTWRATPVANTAGNVDIWMEKIPYDDFTNGLWYQDFGLALDNKYLSSTTGDGLKIFDKMDIIEDEKEFRHVMSSLAGDIYANINQREEDTIKAFENALFTLENSDNNTKENVKVNIIAGKGKNKEATDGVVTYDYKAVGAFLLREVERTYKHTFGYSLGYLHSSYDFKDDNGSEEDVDTIQIGAHSKYKTNDWVMKNNVMGRVGFHNIDRNIDWSLLTGKSSMDAKYETYSISTDNTIGREFVLGKKVNVTPYGGLRVLYVTRPKFTESGLERLEIKSNDAWSVKPRVGVELSTALPLKESDWQIKGTLDLAYEYELANLNQREYAKLVAIEDSYHRLSKPEKEKGQFRTKASLGLENKNKYGLFLTGEYRIEDSDKDRDEYRVGVSFKLIF